MENITIYIVHGYTSSSKAEWFPWLKEKLNEIGINVIVFDMPNSNSPEVKAWDECLEKNINEMNENTYFIGHSLGCITALRYLEKQSQEKRIAGIIMVSGFNCVNPRYPFFDPFIKDNLDTEKIKKMIKKRIVVSSPTDPYAPYKFSCELAKALEAELVTIENGGHFTGDEGFTQFPQLLDIINIWLKK